MTICLRPAGPAAANHQSPMLPI